MIRGKHILFAITLLTFLATACSASASNTQGEHWVIFSASHAKEMKIADWMFGPGQPAEYWTPTKTDVTGLEDKLPTYLRENGGRFYKSDSYLWDSLNEYNRQYIGIIVDGKQVIYANYFCESSDYDWRNKYFVVMDGGDCFFQFKYDADSGSFFDLQVNGMA